MGISDMDIFSHSIGIGDQLLVAGCLEDQLSQQRTSCQNSCSLMVYLSKVLSFTFELWPHRGFRRGLEIYGIQVRSRLLAYVMCVCSLTCAVSIYIGYRIAGCTVGYDSN
jgi:hypothetical protein